MRKYKYKLPRVVEWSLLSYFGVVIYLIITVYRVESLNGTSSLSGIDVLITTIVYLILMGNLTIVWIKRYSDITIRYFLLKIARFQMYRDFKSFRSLKAKKEMASIIAAMNQLILEIYDV